jgi:uncharacterized protein HemX
MAAFSTIAIVSLALSAIGVGVSTYQGEQQRRAQKRSLLAQERAQAAADVRAASTKRQNDLDFAAANRKAPDLNYLIEAQQRRARQGAASTVLTSGRGLAGAFNLPMTSNVLLGA